MEFDSVDRMLVDGIVVGGSDCEACMAESFSISILDDKVGDDGEAVTLFEASPSASDFDDSSTGCMTPISSFMLPARLEVAVIPPAVGKPSSARVVLHCLYFVRGNLSFTSSIDINFFSLRRRCALGTAPISICSPSSPFRSCLFR